MRMLLCLMSAVLVCAFALPVQGALLASAGKAHYTIVTPAEPTAVDLTAAEELKEHLLEITGAEFTVIPENQPSGQFNLIHVGRTKRANQLLSDVDWDSLEHDGIVLRTVGNNIVLAGGKTRGSLYAVYTFLEDVLGVRWWTHNESFIPKKPRLNIGNLNIQHIPKINCREAHFYETNNHPIFAARMKQNGHFQRISPEYGGHYSILGWCHTFYMLIPPEKYFEEHPDWFSLVAGKRSGAAQLCLTNEEMRKELVKNALVWIQRDPQAGIISISINDGSRGECECDKCNAIKEREGASSGTLIEFVNKVAADINEVYPDFLIETIAYSYTVEPPKYVRPAKNVVIRLCNNGQHMWPLTDERNKNFREFMAQWSEIANHLYIWDYIAKFGEYLYPNPSLQVYAPNIRLFEKNKAIGVFMQGDAWNASACFLRMRAWVISHLLWDPHSDQDALVRKFMLGYYGAGGLPLLEYLQLVKNAHNKGTTANWMTPEDIHRGHQLFAQAEEAVKGDLVLTERIVRSRIPLDYLVITRADELREWELKSKKSFPMLKDLKETVINFAAAARKHKATAYGEGVSIETRLKVWENSYTMDILPPAGIGDTSGRRTIDLQEDSVKLYDQGIHVSMVDDLKASNHLALKMNPKGTVWAVQWHLNEHHKGRWHCYGSVRVDAIADKGTAFSMGVYDEPSKKWTTQEIGVNIEDMNRGEYTTVDLGVHDLDKGFYFWFAPVDNPDKVNAFYVDRVFLVEE